MADVTDKDVQQSRERVDRLNAELAEAKATAASGARAGENEYRKAQLDAEADRLQAELDALRQQAQPSAPTTPPPPPPPAPAVGTGTTEAPGSTTAGQR